MGIRVRFLGTGTSTGIPMIGCRCPVCQSTDPRDNRARPAVVVEYDDVRVLIDSPPELRVQCLRFGIDRVDALVFTHAHADHLMGLDDVRRFNTLRQNQPLDAWASPQTWKVIRTAFPYVFGRVHAPGLYRPRLEPHEIAGPFDVLGRTWVPIPLVHGATETLGFRIGDIAYCTDFGEITEESKALLQGVRVLIVDALQHHKHPTHLTITEALALADELQVERAYLTHIAHSVAHEATQAQLPPGRLLAYDGLEISL